MQAWRWGGGLDATQHDACAVLDLLMCVLRCAAPVRSLGTRVCRA